MCTYRRTQVFINELFLNYKIYFCICEHDSFTYLICKTALLCKVAPLEPGPLLAQQERRCWNLMWVSWWCNLYVSGRAVPIHNEARVPYRPLPPQPTGHWRPLVQKSHVLSRDVAVCGWPWPWESRGRLAWLSHAGFVGYTVLAGLKTLTALYTHFKHGASTTQIAWDILQIIVFKQPYLLETPKLDLVDYREKQTTFWQSIPKWPLVSGIWLGDRL